MAGDGVDRNGLAFSHRRGAGHPRPDSQSLKIPRTTGECKLIG